MIHGPPTQPEQEASANTSNKAIVRWTAVVGIAAVCQVIVTCSQWQSMKEGNETNRKALVDVQRAFVFPKSLPIGVTRDREKNLTALVFGVLWENPGSTPTKDLTVNIDSKAFDAQPKGDMFPDNTRNLNNSVSIGPKATIYSDFTAVHGQDLKSVQDGKKFLFVWGELDIETSSPIRFIERGLSIRYPGMNKLEILG